MLTFILQPVADKFKAKATLRVIALMSRLVRWGEKVLRCKAEGKTKLRIKRKILAEINLKTFRLDWRFEVIQVDEPQIRFRVSADFWSH